MLCTHRPRSMKCFRYAISVHLWNHCYFDHQPIRIINLSYISGMIPVLRMIICGLRRIFLYTAYNVHMRQVLSNAIARNKGWLYFLPRVRPSSCARDSFMHTIYCKTNSSSKRRPENCTKGRTTFHVHFHQSR